MANVFPSNSSSRAVVGPIRAGYSMETKYHSTYLGTEFKYTLLNTSNSMNIVSSTYMAQTEAKVAHLTPRSRI